MLSEILNMARKVNSLNEKELKKEISKTKKDFQAEESLLGKPNLNTNLYAHMLIVKDLMNKKEI
jgi:hypothetical protein